MFTKHNRALYDLARAQQRVAAVQLGAADREATETGGSLADILIRRGLIDPPTLLAVLAEYFGGDFLAEAPAALSADAVAEVPVQLARRYGVVPWRADAQAIHLLAGEAFEEDAAEDLAFALGRDVRLVFTDPARVEALMALHQQPDPVASAAGETTRPGAGDDLPIDDLAARANQAPVIRFVNEVLAKAIEDQASDIHFEPFEQEFKIRCRVDGVLLEMAAPPKALSATVISRLKVLANLDIAERRVPQDGRMTLIVAGRPVDLRISTLPTQFGESVVLRVLDRSAAHLEMDELGLPADVLRGIQEVLRGPNGIFLVTGPTGSGKTTTLYSGLRTLNTPETKIVTAEDPIEYDIEGLMQVAVNPAIGLTFATALRSFLRQDPDVMMVGEIRDAETAQVAIQAALTGHLVLSTLHTNDAAGTITRLIDLGIEPFLLASSLEGILAQRLVRRICLDCREARPPAVELREQLGLTPEEVAGRACFAGRGCEHCGQTGYRGRIGLFEWLRVSDEIRELIGQKASTSAIRDRARAQGMRTLREDGLRAIFEGRTTLEEVLKYS